MACPYRFLTNPSFVGRLFPHFDSCIQRGTTKLILLGNMPSKISKKFGFCKFHMENERFCSDVLNAIIAAIQRLNKSFKISQKIAKSSKFDHCVPKPSNFFHFSNFFIPILVPKTLYIYIHNFLYFVFHDISFIRREKFVFSPQFQTQITIFYVFTTSKPRFYYLFILLDTIRSDLTNRFYD